MGWDKEGGSAAILIVVVLVVLFAAWGRRGEEGFGGGVRNDRPADFLEMSRLANFEDPAHSRMACESERETRALEKAIDEQADRTRELLRAQDCQMERLFASAERRADERMFRENERRLEERVAAQNDKILELRELHQFERTNEHMNRLEERLDRRLTHLDERMLKAPPVFGRADVLATRRCDCEGREFA